MTEEEPLLSLGNTVHNGHTGHKVHHFATCCVVEITVALVPPVTVHPLQTELAVRSRFVGHPYPVRSAQPQGSKILVTHMKALRIFKFEFEF